MSRKAFGDGPEKMNTSRRGRIHAFLGILGAVVRGGRGKGGRRASLAGGVPVPQSIRVVYRQPVATAGVDARLLH